MRFRIPSIVTLIALLIVMKACAAHAAIAYVNAWSGNSTNTATSMTVNTSSGTQAAAGNVLVACISELTGNFTLSAPSGWTVAVAQWLNPNTKVSACWYKVAVSGDVGATFTFNSSSAGFLTGGIIALSGENQSSPIDVAGGGSTGNNTALTAASISPACTNDFLLWFGTDDSTGTIAEPASFTAGWQVAGSSTVEGSTGGYESISAAGATGNIASATSGATWMAVLLAIAPSGCSNVSAHGVFQVF